MIGMDSFRRNLL